MKTASKTLTGKRIIITREAERSAELEDLLTQRGAEVIRMPLIETKAETDWLEKNDDILNPNNWDVLVFTSANGVRYFMEALRTQRPSVIAAWKKKQTYAVGKKTERVLHDEHMKAHHLAESHDAASMAEALASVLQKNQRVLFPCGSRSGSVIPDTLARYGMTVKPVIVYRTSGAGTYLPASFHTAPADMITFFSPSGVQRFIELLPDNHLQNFHIAVIGETTARAAVNEGLHVDAVPPKPDIHLLVETIERFYEHA